MQQESTASNPTIGKNNGTQNIMVTTNDISPACYDSLSLEAAKHNEQHRLPICEKKQDGFLPSADI